jgi:hypothetical protein
MIEGKAAQEVLALADAAILMRLLHHLVESGVVKREKALTLLSAAADDLVSNGGQTSPRHARAAEVIRKEFGPKV